jgi:large subunit ribosomal protein L19
MRKLDQHFTSFALLLNNGSKIDTNENILKEEKQKKSEKIKKNSISLNLIQFVEEKFLQKQNILKKDFEIHVGDIIKLGYLIPEGEKDRIQYFEGLIIGKQNRGLGKSFTIRRIVQGIGVEQVFLINSPKIVSIIKKQSSKVRRSKLYYLRFLSGKATRLKSKL